MSVIIQLNRREQWSFEGVCVAHVTALNHDDSVRRIFRLYEVNEHYAAERIDDPDSIDVRYWGAKCTDTQSIYDFFGNEPLANYLYGVLKLPVPGLRCITLDTF